MRLIDADDLAAKIMMEAPDFMDGGSSITKAFILAIVKTRSITPTVDAVPVVRCKDCIYWDGVPTEECNNSDSVCFHNGWCKPDWVCADGEREDKK